MRPISAFAHMMSSNVAVAPKSGQDGYGAPTYGASTTYRAHLSRKSQFVRTNAGQEVFSKMSAHLATDDPILGDAQVTLSTSDVGSTEDYALHPTILFVDRRFDENSSHHVVLFFE